MKRSTDIRMAIGIAVSIVGVVLVILTGVFRLLQGEDTALWALNMFEQFAIGVITIGAALIIVDANINRFEKSKQDTQERAKHKQKLLLQLRSRVNNVAIRAAEELAENGWLRDGTLSTINLQEANLGNTFLPSANLSKTSLVHANVSNADWREVNLDHADLSFADMSRSDLTAAKFSFAEMQNTNLESAFLDSADFRGANLEDANLKNAHLSGVTRYWDEVGGDSITYSAAKFDNTTVLPDGQFWDASTDMRRFTDPNHPNFFVPEPREALDIDL